nr:integrase, catalytic region, zinc finger, CCHC-type, peptidase aspartic, catalytic [Tanacetum cinerariifolium]
MVGGNGGNKFRQYARPNVRNKNGYNAVQNVKNQNPNRNGNVIAPRAEGNATENNGNQIRCYNCIGLGHFARNCTQASTSGTQTDKAPIYDSDRSAEVHNYDNFYDNEIFNMFTQEEQYTESLKPIPEPHQVQRNDSNVIYEDEIFPIFNQVDARLQNFKIQFLEEAAKFVRDFKSLRKEADESLAKHKALELEIERLLKAIISQDIMYVVKNNSVEDTSNLQTELERQPHSSSKPKLYAVTPLPKSKGLPKIDETHALSKPVTSNLVPTPQESKVMKNNNVIALGMFSINPFKPFKEEKYVPNKVRANIRLKPITVSQPNVITKKGNNFDSNGLSSTEVDNTAKARRPQPRSNTKNDMVSSVSKSSCNKNKEVKLEEHPKNLLLSKNKKHMSSECNNVKLAIWNSKSEVVCAMCKKCLITANHDVCVLKYVNDMNYPGKKLKESVSNTENQKKQKPKVMKPKKVGSNKRLALPKPSKPRPCLNKKHMSSECNNVKLAIWNSKSEVVCAMCKKCLITANHDFLGTVRFGNDHVTAILGFSDLQLGNILITRVYFVEGLGHNLFSVGQFCDSDLEVSFRRNICFVRNLEGVDLLKGNRTTNL